MPKNKEALIRYRVINRCLKNNKLVSISYLMEKCAEALYKTSVGKRTIAADIQAMRQDEGLGYFAPILFDNHNRGYYYEDSSYSIDNIPINKEELNALSFAATVFNQFKDIEIFDDFTGAVEKIVNAVNIRRLQNEPSKLNFIEFEKAPKSKGNEFLFPLIKAIKNEDVLNLTYKSFNSDKEIEHTIHPYLLKEYRNRWYLIGYHEKYKGVRTYSFDRIEKIDKHPYLIYKKVDFDKDDFCRNTIGITSSDDTPENIEFKLTRRQANYIITQPIHESQEIIKETDEEVTFTIVATPTYELIAKFLSWGGDFEIVKPVELRKKIMERLKLAVGKYG